MLTIKKRSLLRIYVFGLSVATILCGCSRPIERALSRGDALMRQGKYGDAVNIYKTLTIEYPNEARVWNLLGIAYHNAGDLVAATHSYTTALKLSNNFYTVHYNLGCALFEMRNFLQASREFASYVMYVPQSSDGWTRLGTSQLYLKQYDLAEKSFRAALNLNPKSYESYNGLGIALMYSRRWMESAQCFTNALKLKPDYPPANLNLGIILLQYQKDKAGAASMFKRFLILKPDHPYSPAVSNLLRKLEQPLQLAPTNQIQPLITAPTPITEKTTVIEKATTVPTVVAKKDEKIVQKTETQSFQLSPPVKSQPVAIQNLVSTQQQKITTSTPVVTQKVVKKIDAKIDTNLVIVQGEKKQQQVIEKQPVVQVEKIQPEVPSQQVKTDINKQAEPVIVQTKTDEVKESKKEQEIPQPATQKQSWFSRLNPFKKKGKTIVTPLPPISESQVASATQESGQKEKKAEQKIVEKEVTQEVSPVKVAKTDLPLQIPKYNYLRPQKPSQGNRDEAQKKLLLGLKAHDAGDLKEAKSQYEEAVKLDPSYFEANYNLAIVLLELGELDESLKRYEYALAINPEAPNARFNFALALQKGNYLNDAVKELENYLIINPQDNRARLLLANIYAKQLKDKSNASKQYLEILRTEPNHPQALTIHEWLKQNSQ